MAAGSKIPWCDDTHNEWIGCQEVGPGCDHCYAKAMDRRFGQLHRWGPGRPRDLTSEANRRLPFRWNREARTWDRPRLVFCGSRMDWADNAVPAGWRIGLWNTIRETRNLFWILLTKRVGNILKMLPPDWGQGWPHVAIVITVCNQPEADRDVPKLLRIPAAVRGVSAEPLLGAIDFTSLPMGAHRLNALTGWAECGRALSEIGVEPMIGPRLDWIIPGGESGPHAREYGLDRARSIIDQCAAAGVACFHKQLGRRPVAAEGGPVIRLRDKKGEDPAEWPEDLRVRQFPPQFRHPQSIRRAP